MFAIQESGPKADVIARVEALTFPAQLALLDKQTDDLKATVLELETVAKHTKQPASTGKHQIDVDILTARRAALGAPGISERYETARQAALSLVKLKSSPHVGVTVRYYDHPQGAVGGKGDGRIDISVSGYGDPEA